MSIVKGEKIDARMLKGLAEKFRVSLTAAALRYAELSLVWNYEL